MTRIHTLASRPKRTLGALAVVLAAVGITVGSGANFTAQSAPAAGTFAAGNLKVLTSGNTLFTASALWPGQSTDGTVTVTNNGTVPGYFRLTPGVIAAPAAKDVALRNRLRMTVTDEQGVKVIDDQLITSVTSPLGLPKTGGSVGKWAAGESHTYAFHVDFPDGNATGGTDGADDAAQDGSVTMNFLWKAVS